jgi:hypothetical protein
MAERILTVDLGIDATNDDILDQMRIMQQGREEQLYDNIVCTVRGFAHDQRELYAIPEVRAFCRRLVSLGFISYLDMSTIFAANVPLLAKRAWGAAEVWLASEGRLRAQNPLTHELIAEIQQVVSDANARADKALG